MIDRMSLVGIWVLDQDKALEFYVDTLGFVPRADFWLDGFGRYLTVCPPDQPELEIHLGKPGPPATDEDTAAIIAKLVEQGLMNGGAFLTKDCQRSYEELTARGVTFDMKPTTRPTGITAWFRDPFGTRWTLVQPVKPE